jgi:hypothetical protein
MSISSPLLQTEKFRISSQIAKSQSQAISILRPFLYPHISNIVSSELFLPIPQGSKVKCFIEREKSFFNKEKLFLYQYLDNNYLLTGFKNNGKSGTRFLLGT